jgi:hypothetical protein
MQSFDTPKVRATSLDTAAPTRDEPSITKLETTVPCVARRIKASAVWQLPFLSLLTYSKLLTNDFLL